MGAWYLQAYDQAFPGVLVSVLEKPRVPAPIRPSAWLIPLVGDVFLVRPWADDILPEPIGMCDLGMHLEP